MNTDLEIALDDCLQQLASGTTSLDECLARHPDLAEELRPLLETGLRVQRGRQLAPAKTARARARAKLAEHMRSHPRAHHVSSIPRLAFSLLAALIALTIFSTAFAQGALPGQTLYELKLSTERAWRAASPDPVSVDIQLANRRTDELIFLSRSRKLVAHNDPAEMAGVAAYKDVLGRLATQTNGPEGDEILAALHGHQEQLNQAGVHVPELDDIVAHGHLGGENPGKGPTSP